MRFLCVGCAVFAICFATPAIADCHNSVAAYIAASKDLRMSVENLNGFLERHKDDLQLCTAEGATLKQAQADALDRALAAAVAGQQACSANETLLQEMDNNVARMKTHKQSFQDTLQLFADACAP